MGARLGPARRRRAAKMNIRAGRCLGDLVTFEMRERWSTPEERLVQRDAEAELVGARVDALAAELFGRHVRGRAESGARLRDRRWRRVAGSICAGSGGPAVLRRSRARPKSRTRTRPSRPIMTFCGLEVAVDDAGRVGRREAAARGDEDLEDLAPARGRARSHASSVSPSTNSIAKKTRRRRCRRRRRRRRSGATSARSRAPRAAARRARSPTAGPLRAPP